jgi:hypothetical protein
VSSPQAQGDHAERQDTTGNPGDRLGYDAGVSGHLRRGTLVLAVALLVRLVPVLAADRLTADVLRYHKVAEAVLAGQLNPYQLPRLYPYPPVWVWFEAGSEYLARATGLPFPVLVKLPVVAADLAIVWLLLGWPGAGAAAAWVYALNPVSLLVTGFHGQFDALMLACVLLSLRLHGDGRHDASAIALATAIALKSFPILLLPLFLAQAGGLRAASRYALLALGPVAALLAPFALADPRALVRELLGYGGVADFGWIALVRGLDWLHSGVLARSEARHWPLLVPAAKLAFLAGYGALLALVWRGRLRWPLPQAALAVFLSFQVLYGALSAQYLLWVVPLAALAADAFLVAYSAAATAALVGFYAFLQPAVLQGEPPLVAYAPAAAGRVWVLGVAALLAVSVAWLARLIRRGR